MDEDEKAATVDASIVLILQAGSRMPSALEQHSTVVERGITAGVYVSGLNFGKGSSHQESVLWSTDGTTPGGWILLSSTQAN